MHHGKVSAKVKINAASRVPSKRTIHRTVQKFRTIDLERKKITHENFMF